MAEPVVLPISRPKKAQHAAHHGGAWKVAYADFVTAMMALFIVLWLLTQTDQKTREQIAEYFRTGILPGGAQVIGEAGAAKESASGHGVSSKVPVIESLKPDQIKEAIEKLLTEHAELRDLRAHVQIRVDERGTWIELVDSDEAFLFPLASAELPTPARAFLHHLAPKLAELQNEVEIHGHTDARPFHEKSGRTNWDLSQERASEGRKILEANGLQVGRLTAVVGHGPAKPYKKEDPLAASNRRLAILVAHGPGAGLASALAPTEAATPAVAGIAPPTPHGAAPAVDTAPALGGAVPTAGTAPGASPPAGRASR